MLLLLCFFFMHHSPTVASIRCERSLPFLCFILCTQPENVDFFYTQRESSSAFATSVSYCYCTEYTYRALAAHSEPFNAPCVKGKQAAE